MSELLIQHPTLSPTLLAELAQQLQSEPVMSSGQPDPMISASQIARWPWPSGSRSQAADLAEKFSVDAAWIEQKRSLSDYRLLVFDMDSTLITIECIDEMGDYFGKKNEVAAITEAAMRGEISDYNESLRRRLNLLAGMPLHAMQQIYDERLQLSPGVERLIAASKQAGLKVLLVSGGFTFFADQLKIRLGLDFVRANRVELRNEQLTGGLIGEIVNADVKQRIVEETCVALGCSPAQAIVIGDGANDLKMMSIAGVSVAYRAKPVVRRQALFALNYCPLDAALNFFA